MIEVFNNDVFNYFLNVFSLFCQIGFNFFDVLDIKFLTSFFP